MQLNRKALAFGQLPSSKGDLYAPASGNKGLVHNIFLHNTNTTAETVVLNYHDGTSEHEIFNQSLSAGETVIWDFKGAGDIVEDGGKYTGNTDTASKVTYKVDGTEESPSGSSLSVVGANLWAPPDQPHAEDDEFTESTLVGWTGVQNISDDAAGSFSYDTIDAYDTSFTSGNVVRVNVNDPMRPSWAQLQPPITGKQFMVYRAYSLPTNLLMVARAKFNKKRTSPSNDASVLIALMESTGGVPVSNSRIELFLNESDGTQCQVQSHVVDSSGTTGTSTITTDTDDQGQALEYLAIHKIGSTFHTWVGTAGGNWIYMTSYSSLDFTPNMVGFGAWNSSTAAPGATVVALDFIRFYETDNFLL